MGGVGVCGAGPLGRGEGGGEDGGAGLHLAHQIAEGVQGAALGDGHALFFQGGGDIRLGRLEAAELRGYAHGPPP